MTIGQREQAGAVAVEASPDERTPSRSAPLVAALLVTLYVAGIGVGYVLLRNPLATLRGNELSVDRALFTAINSGTLTGFRQTMEVTQLRPAGQVVVAGLVWLGTTVSLIVGGLAVARTVSYAAGVGRIVLATFALQVIAIGIGASLLALTGQSIASSAFLSLSALGNSGLSIGALPSPEHWATHLVLLPLALVGGLGVVVMLEVVEWLRNGRTPSQYTRIVLAMSAGTYLVTIILVALLSPIRMWGDAIVAGSSVAVDARSAGFGFGLTHARTLEPVLIVLMLIGAASGGTAGGLKLNTLAALWRGGREARSGRAVSRVVGVAIVWIALFALLVVAGMTALLVAEPQMPADRALFIVASAAGNVGLSHDPIAATGPTLFVLSAVMMLGRFLPLGILWWSAMTPRSKDDLPVG